MDKKKKSTLFTRLFGNRNKVTDFMTEEQLQSPGRLILKNFLHNKLGMFGLIIFILIFLLVMIGPKFYTLDLSYQDNTQLNVPPGMNLMTIPEAQGRRHLSRHDLRRRRGYRRQRLYLGLHQDHRYHRSEEHPRRGA